MHTVIDASCLLINRYSGLAEVVHNLLLHLPRLGRDHKYTLFINYFRRPIERKKILYPDTNTLFSRIPRRFVRLWWRAGWPAIDFHLNEADIYHSLHVQIPPTKKAKTVLTVHDCRCLALPQLYKPQVVEKYRKEMETSLSRVDLVATVSEFTRQEVLTYFSFPEDRIRVIHNGFDSSGIYEDHSQERIELLITRNNLPQSYLLYSGALDPRKNLGRLLEAIALCREETQDFPDLVIVGVPQKEWLTSDLAVKVKELGLFDQIYLAGVVERDILFGLTKNALALCYPSLYEGFGFPPLEAMSVGVPVLASKSSAIPEITGHAACLVDPTCVDDIAQGLRKVVFDSDYRQNLIQLGYRRINQFSWSRSASEYINLYKDVLNL